MPHKERKQQSRQPRFTRNVLHGNAMNKRGIPTDFHHGGMRKERRVCFHQDRRTLRSISMEEKSLLHEFTDGVVVGKWDHKQSPMRTESSELRFIIPTSPNNRHVIESMVERASELKNQALQELREKSQSDGDREIWLID